MVARKLRIVTVVLLALGGLALVLGGLWALVADPAGAADGRGGGAVERGLLLVLNHRLATPMACAAIALGTGALALAWALLRRPASWPLLAIPPVTVGLFVMIWRGRDWVAHFEPIQYRARSPYVRGATWLATATSLYLVALVAAALTAWFASRPRPPAPPSAAPSP